MTKTTTTTQANGDGDADAALGKALVAAILYYTPVTIVSLSQIDLSRAVMMALYLLPFVVMPLVGLWRAAARPLSPRHALALSR